MKRNQFFITLLLVSVCFPSVGIGAKPCVVVTNDINAGSGDPDDSKSHSHLLYYANVLDISVVILDRSSDSAVDY